MGIKDEIVHCRICEKNKPFGEIGKAEVIKGEMIYICKDCILNGMELRNEL